MNAPRIPQSAGRPSVRQMLVRQRASRLYLHGAVRLAASEFFRFTHRAQSGKALWSKSEHVWLGSQTFLNWALWDAEINLPWMVALAADAPDAADELHEAIHVELVAYWAEQLAALPSKSTPGWLPLP